MLMALACVCSLQACCVYVCGSVSRPNLVRQCVCSHLYQEQVHAGVSALILLQAFLPVLLS